MRRDCKEEIGQLGRAYTRELALTNLDAIHRLLWGKRQERKHDIDFIYMGFVTN